MKNGWKLRSSFSAIPTWPASFDANTDIFHAVILSAIGKLMCACPCLSVITSGRHTSVSGKYLRSRGVKRGFSIELVPALGARELTDAVSDTAPTFNLKSTCVEIPG